MDKHNYFIIACIFAILIMIAKFNMTDADTSLPYLPQLDPSQTPQIIKTVLTKPKSMIKSGLVELGTINSVNKLQETFKLCEGDDFDEGYTTEKVDDVTSDIIEEFGGGNAAKKAARRARRAAKKAAKKAAEKARKAAKKIVGGKNINKKSVSNIVCPVCPPPCKDTCHVCPAESDDIKKGPLVKRINDLGPGKEVKDIAYKVDALTKQLSHIIAINSAIAGT